MFNIAKPRAAEAAKRIAPTVRAIAVSGYAASRGLLRRISRDQRGATAITTALVLMVLVGFVGLGTEVGMWYAERRAMQNASDAAALGAGFDIYVNGKKSTGIVAAGQADSARNGFTNGTNNVTVAVNYPPKEGTYANKKSAVETVVSKTRASLFAAFFMDGPVDIKVRSVATVKYIGVYCILALSPHDEAALLFDGTADVQLKNCGINVNSDDSDGAMTAKGASVVGATYAEIVGGLDQTNNAELDLGDITTGADAIDDPYANLDVPDDSGCDYTDFVVGASKTMTLSPGRYCNGLKIQGTAYLEAGEYVIVGGTFDVTSTAHVTTDEVDGVTIFLTGSGSDYAQVTINGGARHRHRRHHGRRLQGPRVLPGPRCAGHQQRLAEQAEWRLVHEHYRCDLLSPAAPELQRRQRQHRHLHAHRRLHDRFHRHLRAQHRMPLWFR